MRTLALSCLLPWAAMADGVWLGGGGGNWGAGANWLNADIPSAAGESGAFDSLDLIRDTVVTLDGTRVVGRLKFSDVTPSHEWVLRKGTGGALVMDAAVGVPEVVVDSGVTRIGAEIAGSKGLVKSGAGTLILEGNNQWTGPTRISGGALRLGPSPAIPSNIKVMPLGDSITFGYNGTNSGYRGPLYNLLLPLAADFRFVGASNINSNFLLPPEQRWHEARSSYNIQDVYLNLDGFDNTRFLLFGGNDRDPNGGHWLTGTGNRAPAFPDVITLMLGTNDLELQAGVENRYRSLIDKITSLRPDSRLLAAKIVPSSLVRNGTNFSTVVINFNQIVSQVVADFQAAGRNVRLVDLHTRFPSNGLHADLVHPVDAGFNWMAVQWHEAIVRSYTPASGVTTGLPPQTDLSVDAGARLELAGNSASFASLNVAGIVDFGSGGELRVPMIRVAKTGRLTGGGTVKGTLINDGSAMGAPGQEVVFEGAVINNTTSWLSPGSQLTLLTTFVNNGVLDVGFGSRLNIQGYLVNNGTLRITAGALLELDGTLINNGILDIMTGPEIPTGHLINLGLVLDAGVIRLDAFEVKADSVRIEMQGYPGHVYQLQYREDLGNGDWVDIGDIKEVIVPGKMHFDTPRPAGRRLGFYRVRVLP